MKPLLALVTAFLLIGCSTEPESKPVESASGAVAIVHQSPAPAEPDYIVLADESGTNPDRVLIRKHVLLKDTSSKAAVQAEMEGIFRWELAHRNPEASLWQLAFFCYKDLAHYEGGGAQWIGMLSAQGNDPPEYRFDDRQFGAPRKRRLAQITEAKEKEVYAALSAAQDRAYSESMKAHPDPNDLDAQEKMMRELTDSYETQARRHFRISLADEAKIEEDAQDSSWAAVK